MQIQSHDSTIEPTYLKKEAEITTVDALNSKNQCVKKYSGKNVKQV